MLTPQDIQNKVFEKAVFGGYDMTAVDDYLEEIITDLAALQKENAILKSKIKVLVEKVEEYRSTEDAMRMALLTAQKMGDDIMDDARKKSQAILSEAETSAQNRKAELDRNLQVEVNRLKAAQDKTRQYIQAVKSVMAEQSLFLERLDQVTGPAEAIPAVPEEPVKEAEAFVSAREEEILDTAEQIDSYVSQILADEPEPSAPAAPAQEETRKFRKKTADVDWSDDDEYTSPRPKFDFENLQFGAEFFDD